jgi:hypothetical protein
MARAGKIFLYVVYFAVVVVLGGVITHSLTKSSTPKSPKPSKPATSQQHKQAASPKPGSSQPGAPASTPLANSGPGDVAGIFVAASVSGALMYRFVIINRLKNTG